MKKLAKSTAATGAMLLAVATISVPALAYTINPAAPIHEAITLAALKCVDKAGAKLPRDCGVGTKGLLNGLLEASRRGAGWKRPAWEFGELEIASRWPDDPTREIAPVSAAKFGATAKFACPLIVKRQDTIDRGGIRCHSHHGQLQFFHAMSSGGDDVEVTRGKVLAWAEHAYRVGSGILSPDTPYCNHFDKNPDEISLSLRPKGFRFCDNWSVGTIFNWRCRNAFWSGRCKPIQGFGAEIVTRRAALGALLHVIQDSYSESHTDRGGGSEPEPSTRSIRCKYPRSFFDYSRQRSSIHGNPDRVPNAWSDVCLQQGEVDDVVTATATMIWAARRQTSEGLVRRYLACRVFGVPAEYSRFKVSLPKCDTVLEDLALN